MDQTIFVRSAIIAAVVGAILTSINQSGWVAGRDPLQLLPLMLVFLLPFAVVTTAQILGIRQASIDSIGNWTLANSEGFTATIVAHGIPRRAVVIGLVFGSLNAIVTLADAFLSTGDFTAVSVVPWGRPMRFRCCSDYCHKPFHTGAPKDYKGSVPKADPKVNLGNPKPGPLFL